MVFEGAIYHVHLLVETPRANLSGFMATLLTGHALYFNRRHGGVGACWSRATGICSS